MNIYLKHLVAAFNLVDKKYHSSNAYNGFREKKGEEVERKEFEQFIERVFAYELYHQFRLIMLKFPEEYKDLILNGEVSKNGFEDTSLGKNRIFPDLVLHKNQKTSEAQFQKLFIEIKTSKNLNEDSLKSDIKKLFVAISDRLNYQNAVFICINHDYKNLIKKIKDILKDKESLELKQLWILTDTKGLQSFKEIK